MSDHQVVLADSHEESGRRAENRSGAASSSSAPVQQKNLKQFTLRKFLSPGHPQAQEMAAKPSVPQVGRPPSRKLAEILEKNGG